MKHGPRVLAAINVTTKPSPESTTFGMESQKYQVSYALSSMGIKLFF